VRTDFPVVGVVGGGQLARMMQPAAINLGVTLRVLAAGPQESAAQVIPDAVVGDEKNVADLLAFAEGCDVVTFDHEHVHPDHLQALEEAGHIIRPGRQALLHAQDKGVMRERMTALGVANPRHHIVATPDQAAAFAEQLPPEGSGDRSVVLKTTRGGYDGKGVWLSDATDIASEPFAAGVPVLVEEPVDFRRELAAVAVRSPHGQAVAYPVVESVQIEGICLEVIALAPGLAEDVAVQAQRLALQVAAEIGVVGVLVVELFETTDGDLVVNELAMRPHNSAHWSIDGAVTSQFENHLRAVLDLPLGDPSAQAPYTVMVNALGGDLDGVYGTYKHLLARDPALKVHWYGKAVRPGRKIGHVNLTGADVADLRERGWHAADYIAGVIDE